VLETHRGRGDRRPDDTAVAEVWHCRGGLGACYPANFRAGGCCKRDLFCQALKLSLLEYYSKCIMRSWLVVAVMWALTKLVDWPSVINGWLSLAAASAMLLLGYATLVFFVVLDAGERDRLINRLGFLFGG